MYFKLSMEWTWLDQIQSNSLSYLVMKALPWAMGVHSCMHNITLSTAETLSQNIRWFSVGSIAQTMPKSQHPAFCFSFYQVSSQFTEHQACLCCNFHTLDQFQKSKLQFQAMFLYTHFHNHTNGLGAHIFSKVLIVYLVTNEAGNILLTINIPCLQVKTVMFVSFKNCCCNWILLANIYNLKQHQQFSH